MGYFPVRYASRVVIYERKMFIRLDTGLQLTGLDSVVSVGTNNNIFSSLV